MNALNIPNIYRESGFDRELHDSIGQHLEKLLQTRSLRARMLGRTTLAYDNYGSGISVVHSGDIVQACVYMPGLLRVVPPMDYAWYEANVATGQTRPSMLTLAQEALIPETTEHVHDVLQREAAMPRSCRIRGARSESDRESELVLQKTKNMWDIDVALKERQS